MLGHTRNAISAYRKAGMEVAVEVADPYRLILLLFEGAQAAVGSARAAVHKTDRRQRRVDLKGHRYHQQRPEGQSWMRKRAVIWPDGWGRSTITWCTACCRPA